MCAEERERELRMCVKGREMEREKGVHEGGENRESIDRDRDTDVWIKEGVVCLKGRKR